jgi:hypothetical protein
MTVRTGHGRSSHFSGSYCQHSGAVTLMGNLYLPRAQLNPGHLTQRHKNRDA